MYKLVQGDSTKYFKTNDIDSVSLVLTSPSYFNEEGKKGLLDGEIGYGETKETYVNLISNVIESILPKMNNDSKIVMVLGRYNDLSIQSILYMLEDRLNKSDVYLCGYTLHNKGNHEAVVVFNKGSEIRVDIPEFYKLQIYDKVGFFGRINNDILDWAINSFTKKGELVIDPFAGAGSTVKRASNLDRAGLGVELNPDFIK